MSATQPENSGLVMRPRRPEKIETSQFEAEATAAVDARRMAESFIVVECAEARRFQTDQDRQPSFVARRKLGDQRET